MVFKIHNLIVNYFYSFVFQQLLHQSGAFKIGACQSISFLFTTRCAGTSSEIVASVHCPALPFWQNVLFRVLLAMAPYEVILP